MINIFPVSFVDLAFLGKGRSGGVIHRALLLHLLSSVIAAIEALNLPRRAMATWISFLAILSHYYFFFRAAFVS